MPEKICRGCGAVLDDGIKFCAVCGTKAEEEAEAPVQEQDVFQQSPAPEEKVGPAPARPERPPHRQEYVPAKPRKDSKYAEISTLGWVGILILTAIPVVGFILILIWAFGGCRKVAKMKYARACLILILIAVVIMIALILVCRFAVLPKVRTEILTQYGIDITKPGAVWRFVDDYNVGELVEAISGHH